LISGKADGANIAPSKKVGLLFVRNASTYGIALSPAKDEAGYESDEESDDCESSKLNCVVGVDRDEVGESAVKNWGIRVRSRVRSMSFSWTKEERNSLPSMNVDGVEDIKVDVAGADGAGVSVFIFAVAYVGASG
jgi:hypothetical protein